MKTLAYLKMHNTPTLKALLKTGKEDNKAIKNILKERNKNFFNNVEAAVIYHEL